MLATRRKAHLPRCFLFEKTLKARKWRLTELLAKPVDVRFGSSVLTLAKRLDLLF